MGRLGQQDDMQTHRIGGSTLQFSAKKIDQLGASEYTLGVVMVDVSGSLCGLEKDLDKLLGAIVGACRDPRNPRADNMMLMVLLFNNDVVELHGFRPVMDLNPDDYKGACTCAGITAARDAAYLGAKACSDYAAQLVQQQFAVNGALFLITDGADNASKASVKMVKEAIAQGVRAEALESMIAVLIGIGSGSSDDVAQLSAELKDFHDNAGFTQYVYAGNADSKTLARVAGFVARSHSSQSQALGTGGPSQSLAI